ncbi:MAG: hypothetical protein KBD48_00260 [Candidatus Pacebacteria bacterium]|nr:hypothetical protein [Candidatus Paceibacterota bacterium]MBP9715612.1 hypothetical protein [Candidatus Paceibacterota bacterium]
MKFFLSIVLILLNVINIPLSMLFMKVQAWYLPMWKKDKIIYFAFAPFYWILVALTFIVGYPCEQIPQYIH